MELESSSNRLYIQKNQLDKPLLGNIYIYIYNEAGQKRICKGKKWIRKEDGRFEAI